MQPSLERAVESLVAAWNIGDPAGYAAQFTDDATYVIYTGALSAGRDAIAHDHEPVFRKWQRGSRMRMVVMSARMLSDDVAVVVSEGGVGKRRRISLGKVQTFVFHRQPDGQWLCAAFQNTKKNRLALRLHRMTITE